jgi:DNA-binding transcriptional ArsR family regulator
MPTDHLSATFGALADPTRRAILARLALGEASVKELAEPFDMSLQAISKHLKVLERGGLIMRGREAQWRPCRIEVSALREVDDWLVRYRQLWEERLDRLGEYLARLKLDKEASSKAEPAIEIRGGLRSERKQKSRSTGKTKTRGGRGGTA